MCDLCKPNYSYNSSYCYSYGLTLPDLDFEYWFDKSVTRRDEPNPANNLPKVGDTVRSSQSEGLPIGTILRSESGELFVRGSKYNDYNYFLMSLEREDSLRRYNWGKFTIQYIPGWKKNFEVGDVVSHAQAQLLPRFTVLVYEPDEWMKRHCATGIASDNFQSHWFVDSEKVSNRCGVVRPMNGKNHWSSFYKIVYLPQKTN